MAQIFETVMLICFGLSWPFNIVKSLRSKTAKGKSIPFEVCVIIGYLCGIAGKFAAGQVTYVLAFYLVDVLMVLTDLALTCKNRRRDRFAEERKEFSEC